MPRLISVARTAEQLGCSKGLIYKLIHSDLIPHVRLSEQRYGIPEDRLEEWIQAGGVRSDYRIGNPGGRN